MASARPAGKAGLRVTPGSSPPCHRCHTEASGFPDEARAAWKGRTELGTQPTGSQRSFKSPGCRHILVHATLQAGKHGATTICEILSASRTGAAPPSAVAAAADPAGAPCYCNHPCQCAARQLAGYLLGWHHLRPSAVAQTCCSLNPCCARGSYSPAPGSPRARLAGGWRGLTPLPWPSTHRPGSPRPRAATSRWALHTWVGLRALSHRGGVHAPACREAPQGNSATRMRLLH